MAVFDYARVKDPAFYAENVLPAYASGKYYAPKEGIGNGGKLAAMP